MTIKKVGHAQQEAAGEAEDRTGHEKHGREGEEQNVTEGRPHAKLKQQRLDELQIDVLPIEDKRECARHDGEYDQPTRLSIFRTCARPGSWLRGAKGSSSTTA